MGLFKFEIFCDSVACGSGFNVFRGHSSVLEGKVPQPHDPPVNSCQPALHCTCRTTIPCWHTTFFIYIDVHPVFFISLFFFTYLTATTLSTSFPVSCKELLPKQTPLTSADFKRQKYEVGCFRHIQHFLESWLVCALNECSTLLLHDLKVLDFFHVTEMCLVMKGQISQENFAILDPFKNILTLHWHCCSVSDPAAQCFSLFNKAGRRGDPSTELGFLASVGQLAKGADTGRASQEKLEVSYKTPT